ncbi:MAG TPA: hypothetical protein VGH38_33905 [Bryobacteraceae bacterium]
MRVVWALFACVLCCSAINPLESRLDRQMRFWQKRLGLEEWNLSLRVVRQTEIDRNSWGAAEWDPDAKSGTISVLDPRDYNLHGGELKLDMECTIVHELVHIQVSPLAARDEHVREEVVNRIMVALMNRQCPN